MGSLANIPPDPVLLAALACIATSSAMLVYLVMINRPEAVAGRTGGPVRRIDNPVMRIALPLARALAPIHKNAEVTASGKDLDRKISRAGRPWGMTVPEFMCLRYIAIFAGALFGYLVSIGFYGQPQLLWALVGAVLFFTIPNSRLKQAVETRRIAIFRDLPNVLDILVLSTEAGQDFSSAMGTLVEKGPPGPLVDEFRVTQQEVMLGKSRADALRAMSERVDLPELTSFILALVQAEQLGAPIGKILRIMGEQARIKRFTLAEELAGKVPVKLMAPLFVCIFPASFIVLGVPIFLQAQGGGL